MPARYDLAAAFSRRRRSQPTGSAPTMAASSTLVARSRSPTGSESGGSCVVNPGGALQLDTGGNSGELRPDRHFGLVPRRGTASFTTRALNRRSAMREVRSSSTSPVRLEGQGEPREYSALLHGFVMIDELRSKED